MSFSMEARFAGRAGTVSALVLTIRCGTSGAASDSIRVDAWACGSSSGRFRKFLSERPAWGREMIGTEKAVGKIGPSTAPTGTAGARPGTGRGLPGWIASAVGSTSACPVTGNIIGKPSAMVAMAGMAEGMTSGVGDRPAAAGAAGILSATDGRSSPRRKPTWELYMVCATGKSPAGAKNIPWLGAGETNACASLTRKVEFATAGSAAPRAARPSGIVSATIPAAIWARASDE